MPSTRACGAWGALTPTPAPVLMVALKPPVAHTLSGLHSHFTSTSFPEASLTLTGIRKPLARTLPCLEHFMGALDMMDTYFLN